MICSVVVCEEPSFLSRHCVFYKDVYEPGLDNTVKYLPQVTVHTDSSLAVKVKYISTIGNGCK